MLAGFALAAVIPTFLRAEPPRLRGASCHAIRPGEETRIEFHGDHMADASAVWTNLPGKTGPIIEASTKNRAAVRFQPPAETPLGIYGIRMATRQGISNLRVLLVDDLRTVQEGGDNGSPDAAQELSLPTAVEGSCEAEGFDYFRFSAKAGERVTVEVLARRLGSPLDPVVRLLDRAGRRVLTFSDDEAGLSGDARLAHVFEQTGEYLLEVRDARYRGGDDYFYRLRIGSFPRVNACFPLAVAPRQAARLELVGPDAEQVPPVHVRIPQQAPGDQIWVTVKSSGQEGAAFVPVGLSNLPQTQESEPNNARDQSNELQLPTAVNGRFRAAKDQDYFTFSATKGERWFVRGEARQFGLSTDLFLRIYDGDGKKLAEAEDENDGKREGAIDFTVPQDGRYHLMVEDLHRRGGPQHAYRLEITRRQPGFSLAVTDSKKQPLEHVNAPRGGWFQIRVLAARRDFEGPIELAVKGLEGLELRNNTIAAKKKEIVLEARLPSDWKPGEARTFRIVGRGKIKEEVVTAQASTLPALRKLLELRFPPRSLAAEIGLGVGPEFPAFFTLSVKEKNLKLPKQSAKGNLTVQVNRLHKFNGAIRLHVEGLPKGLTAEAGEIAAKQPEGKIAFRGEQLAPGEYSLRIIGEGRYQGQRKKAAIADIKLSIE